MNDECSSFRFHHSSFLFMSYAHRITGKKKIKLKDFNPDHDAGLTREEAEAKTAKLGAEMQKLQELLYAAGAQSVLIVLQGRWVGHPLWVQLRTRGCQSPQSQHCSCSNSSPT